MLLLHGWDPYHPDAPFWFTIGGAAEPGETLPEAAARELLEEVGIAVDPALLGAPIAVAAIMFTWAGMLFDQDQTFFACPMDDVDVVSLAQEPWNGRRSTSTAGCCPRSWRRPASAPRTQTCRA